MERRRGDVCLRSNALSTFGFGNNRESLADQILAAFATEASTTVRRRLGVTPRHK